MIGFLARRMMVPRRLHVATIITSSSVLGIVIGTAALICVMSIFNGFRDLAKTMMVSFEPHIQIEYQIPKTENHKTRNEFPVEPKDELPAELPFELPAELPFELPFELPAELPVERSYQRTEARVVALVRGVNAVVSLVGVPASSTPADLEWLRRSLVIGDPVVASDSGMPSVVLSVGTASTLRAYPGDTITFVSPEMISSSLMTMAMPSGRQAVVRGIFQSNANREADNAVTFTSNDFVLDLRPKAAQRSLAIRLKDADRTDEVAAALRASLPKGVRVRTWKDANKGLYDVMQLERLGSFLVLALIIVVAAFNIVVALTLSVRQKRRDIAVLRTMGMRASDIQRVWLLQGALIGTSSVIVGTLLGLGVCWGQQQFSWVAFDMAEGYLVPALPVVIHASDVAVVAATALVLSLLAAIYPARRAGRMRIVEGIREE